MGVNQIGHDSFPLKKSVVTSVLEKNDSQPVLVPPGTNHAIMLPLKGQITCGFGSVVVLTYYARFLLTGSAICREIDSTRKSESEYHFHVAKPTFHDV